MARNVWLRSLPVESRHTFFCAPNCGLALCSLLLGLNANYTNDILTQGNLLVAKCSRAVSEVPQAPLRHAEQPRWIAPPHECIKLNVDTAVSPTNHKAGVGGVFRDAQGRWILDFSRFVGRCDVLVAKIWAIYDGLRQAWESDFSWELLAREWRVVVQHVSRSSNKVVDKLVARGRGLGTTQTFFFFKPPADIVSIVEDELLEIGSTVSELTGIYAPLRHAEQPRWIAPPHECIKLNVDTAVSPTNHKASVGGVFRDAQGRWILDFSRFVGRCDVLVAKIWAIYDGLRQAWESDFSWELLAREWRVVVQHTGVGGREDRLASSYLLDHVPRPLLVMDMATESGNWDWVRLRQLLPEKSLEHITLIYPPCDALGDDRPQWRWESDCKFSTKSAYSFLVET
ncbi:hypothetical protein V6N12_019153 [Hibiscus sabdariffa]|uniref:RNase H type-1 domain-containing protein n=1 Tax=Hibiscus sabdariffa TaxID=183260 RepID=A0ABR1ZHS6_9ROSI